MVSRSLRFIFCKTVGLDQVYWACRFSYYFAKKKKTQTTVVLAIQAPIKTSTEAPINLAGELVFHLYTVNKIHTSNGN